MSNLSLSFSNPIPINNHEFKRKGINKYKKKIKYKKSKKKIIH